MRFDYNMSHRMKLLSKLEEHNLRLLISAQVREEVEERISNIIKLRIEEEFQNMKSKIVSDTIYNT